MTNVNELILETLVAVYADEYGLKLTLGTNIRGAVTARCEKPAPKSRMGYKILFNYYYASDERRIEALRLYADQLLMIKQRKEEERAKKSAANADFKAADHFNIGDIIENSWGYEQTNTEFYQVIEVLPKSLKVRRISEKSSDFYSHGMACNVSPDIDNFCGEPFLLKTKMQVWGDKPTCVICNPKSYYYFHKWDGSPSYKSWYA